LPLACGDIQGDGLQAQQFLYRRIVRADHHMLAAEEFIRRFLLHVLPKRFVRIRHYGLLAGRNVTTQLARCRQLLGVADVQDPVERTWLDQLQEWTQHDLNCCPQCQGPLSRQPLQATAVSGVAAPERADPLGGVDSS